MTPFPLVFLLNACEAYRRKLYITAIVDLTDHVPMLTLQKCFLCLNLTYMNITDCPFVLSLNLMKPTPEEPEHLTHKLPNYTVLLISNGIMIFLYCKYRCSFNHSKTSAMFWNKKNQKETEAMLHSSLQ